MRRPQRGDVLVSKRTASEDYQVGVFPEPPQFSVASRERALWQAFEFAASRQVNAWYTENHRDFLPLTASQAAAAAPCSKSSGVPTHLEPSRRPGAA